MASKEHLQHAGALAVLSGLILIRWWAYLGSPVALGDEAIYLRAFEEVANGRSAYEVSGYYYPPTFADLGAGVLAVVGETGTRMLLRGGSVLGLATTLWISFCLWPVAWHWRLGAGALYLAVAPAVRYGIESGNISFLVSGAILFGLAAWSLKPVLSGLALAASVAIKPLAPLPIVALLMHRPVPPTQRNWVAGGIAGGLASLLLIAHPDYLSTTAGAVGRLPFIRSISLNRILVLLNLEVSPVVLAGIVGLFVVLVARLIPMTRQELLCFGGIVGILAVPIIWSHTLLLTLPAQVLSLTRALERRRRAVSMPTERDGRSAAEVWRRYELLFVILAIAALQLTGGAGAIDDQPIALQLVVLTGAYLAAPVLMTYLLATRSDQPESRPD